MQTQENIYAFSSTCMLDKMVTCYRADGTATFFKCTRSSPSTPIQQDPNMGDYCRGKKKGLVWNETSLYLNTDLPYPDRSPARPADSQSWPTFQSPGFLGQNRAVLVQAVCMPSHLCNTDHKNKLSKVLQVLLNIILIYTPGIDKWRVLISGIQMSQSCTSMFVKFWALVLWRLHLHTFPAWWTWSAPLGFVLLLCPNPKARSRARHKGQRVASPEPTARTNAKFYSKWHR